jgi:hypothetical protein
MLADAESGIHRKDYRDRGRRSQNAPGFFAGDPTEEAFKESGITATDSPAEVWNLPVEDRRTASDPEQCAVLYQ